MTLSVPVATASGRVLYVGQEPYHVTLSDAATHHAGYTLLTAQARELASALVAAANAVEGVEKTN